MHCGRWDGNIGRATDGGLSWEFEYTGVNDIADLSVVDGETAMAISGPAKRRIIRRDATVLESPQR